MAEFRAAVRRRHGAAVVDLHGQIDRAADGPLAAAYAEAAAQEPGAIVLNFEGVDYINSTGIALIVGLLARARAGHRTIGACGLSDHYREIFEITRLSDFMGIYADEDSAAAPAAAANTGRQS
jgi:anti-sigma B factor antagonist